MDETLLRRLRAQIVRFFGRRLEGTGCVYEMANELRADGRSNDEHCRLLQEAVESLVTSGHLRRVATNDGHEYTGYNVPYELT